VKAALRSSIDGAGLPASLSRMKLSSGPLPSSEWTALLYPISRQATVASLSMLLLIRARFRIACTGEWTRFTWG